MKTSLKDQILNLRDSGATYTEIEKVLECSKGVISYHCNSEVRSSVKERTKEVRKRDKERNTLYSRIDTFKSRAPGDHKESCQVINKTEFGVKQVLEMIGPEPKCALSGRPIVLSDTKSWTLDHITPVSKGGTNELSNMQLVLRDANMCKGAMLMDELLALCSDILSHHSYTVSRA